MDSFARAKLKSENVVIRSQLDELNHKLDVVNSLLNKYLYNSATTRYKLRITPTINRVE